MTVYAQPFPFSRKVFFVLWHVRQEECLPLLTAEHGLLTRLSGPRLSDRIEVLSVTNSLSHVSCLGKNLELFRNFTDF